MSFLSRVFGDPTEKELRILQRIVDEVNALEAEVEKLTDEELAAKTAEFRQRIGYTAPNESLGHPLVGSIVQSYDAEGFYPDAVEDDEEEESEEERLKRLDDTLDDILPEAFAVVREASKRILGMRHYDVQLIGGIILHQGKIAEMRTGEGKTLVATLALYLNGLAGYGAHLVTVNDYLARRDAGWNAPLYHFLGLNVAVISGQDQSYIYDPDFTDPQHDDERLRHLRPCTRREAYLADVTYCTNNELGFDYLRDNMVPSLEYCVQRRLHYAIIDEADSILIDEARTPLIISGQGSELVDKYNLYARIVPQLKPEEDYTIDEKAKAVTPTEAGVEKVEKLTGIVDFFHPEHHDDAHKLNKALVAYAIYQKDRDYIVKDGDVIIVDEFTGRTLPGRRWSDGLHQAIEAKEGLEVHQQEETKATITFQNYFLLYDKLAGMTGTAVTESEEFHKIYDLEVVPIPTNRPLVREDARDVVYRTQEAKYKAIVDEIIEAHKRGQPVLVGTTSIEKSELLSRLLDKKGIPHNVLNAKQHEREASIVAEAGKKGAVTIATNMAGRGTDIVLDDDARDSGGLYIIGTERHESRRIDNQLRGRSGRQGDPGTTRFFLALDDDLFRIFGGDRMQSLLDRFNLEEDFAIESKLITRQMEGAQTRVEGMHFDTRRSLVEYDNVMNTQREIIYGERRKILEGADTKANIQAMIRTLVTGAVPEHCEGKYKESWDIDSLDEWVRQLAPVAPLSDAEYDEIGDSLEELTEFYIERLNAFYDQKEQQYGPLVMRQVEQATMLGIIDQRWSLYLTEMEHLKESAKLRAYAQLDPVIEYKGMAHKAFQDLLEEVQFDIVRNILQRPIQVIVQDPSGQTPQATLEQRAPHSGRPDLPGSMVDSHIPPPARPAAAAASAALARQTMGNRMPERLTYKGGSVETATKPSVSTAQKVGRNDPCPCGSGKKYKRCHGM